MKTLLISPWSFLPSLGLISFWVLCFMLLNHRIEFFAIMQTFQLFFFFFFLFFSKDGKKFTINYQNLYLVDWHRTRFFRALILKTGIRCWLSWNQWGGAVPSNPTNLLWRYVKRMVLRLLPKKWNGPAGWVLRGLWKRVAFMTSSLATCRWC